jgi:ATP-dependent Lhr-like helicase
LRTAIDKSIGYSIVSEWMEKEGKAPFDFQKKTWARYARGYSGMVVAPTGFGKTFSVFLAVLIDFLNHPNKFKGGLQLLWVTPLRSLAKDLGRAMQTAIDSLGLDWIVETRNGDTDAKVKSRQSKSMPEVLLVTPESLHLLLAQKGRSTIFKNLQCVAVDEWHELMGSKRGVMVELALAWLKVQENDLRIWGITAIIGNLEESLEVLLPHEKLKTFIKAKEKKKVEIISVLPDTLEILPWAGHMGAKMAEKVVPIILASRSTLLFTNTRSQSEAWYQLLLAACPELAGQMALHHSSIDAQLRTWIEEQLGAGNLKVVVATSSLDLGVDFKPVDTVIQVGSSKGVARFLQRAGRSGHAPHEVSHIYFVPTHSLELLEVAALKEAVKRFDIEPKEPLVLTFDVLVQFMVTIALGGGFYNEELFKVVKNTFAFQSITEEKWNWCIQFITVGGRIGASYQEFHKVQKMEDGMLVVASRRIGMLHRMNLGVIVSDAMMKVKMLSGAYIGMVEEYFIAKLKTGDKFVLAGRIVELVRINDLTAYVKSATGNAITPSWLGGRLPLSANLSYYLRSQFAAASSEQLTAKELKFLQPLLAFQQAHSYLPQEDELLIEYIITQEGYHLFFYPFEGRMLHEVMASLIAYRISQLAPISFSMSMNDYGFELFSDSPIKVEEIDWKQLFSRGDLIQDVTASINATEMARHKFRDIAVISGLVIQRMYGKQKNNKSLHASSSLIFRVYEEFEPYNLLLKQAYNEVFFQQIEEVRLLQVMERINKHKIVFKQSDRFTPLSFPIKVDSLRQSLSSENLRDRIEKMQKSTYKENVACRKNRRKGN